MLARVRTDDREERPPWSNCDAIWRIAPGAECDPRLEGMLDDYISRDNIPTVGYGVGGTLSVIFLAYLCMMCCMRSQIHTIIDSLQHATDIIKTMPTLVLLPIIQAFLKLSVLCGLVMGLCWVISLANRRRWSSARPVRRSMGSAATSHSRTTSSTGSASFLSAASGTVDARYEARTEDRNLEWHACSEALGKCGWRWTIQLRGACDEL